MKSKNANLTVLKSDESNGLCMDAQSWVPIYFAVR